MCNLPPRDIRSHAELYLARNSVKDQEQQDLLAAAEHEAFAREFVRDGPPVIAPVSVALATPAYTAAKALGMTKARSKASMMEIGTAFRGIADGLQMRYGDK